MPQTCQYEVKGNPSGQTLFFIHGWPDDASLWRQQVKALGKDYRCVLVTLPNFGDEPVNAGGFDFPQLIAMLSATLDDVLPESERTTLVLFWLIGGLLPPLGHWLQLSHAEQVNQAMMDFLNIK